MNWTYFEPEKHTRNDLMSVWIKHSEHHQRWTVQVCVRGMRGIYYLEDAYEGDEPTPEILVRDARMRGIFSARPSYIWQPYDYSMTYCVLAMFHNWCRSRELEPTTLVEQAYPAARGCPELDFRVITAQAGWEGTAYPAQWDTEATKSLLAWLHSIGCAALVNVMEKAIRRTS